MGRQSFANGSRIPKVSGKETPFDSINVTPLTDVMLVLLITFLLTASSFQDSESPVPLPQVTRQTEIESRAEVVTVSKEGEILAFGPGELESQLRALAERSPFTTLAIAVNRDCAYGKLYPLLDAARRAGWKEILLLTEVNS